MPNDEVLDGRWCVVTHYKENYALLPSFISYYHQYYGINRFFILCGLLGQSTHDSLKQMVATKLRLPVPKENKIYTTAGNRDLTVSEFSLGNLVLWIASHPATEFTPDTEFQKLRLDFAAWGESFLPAEISRTIVVDTDEFLYVKDRRMLDGLDSLGFHFVDVIPSPVWPPTKLKFSLQGWYYSRQSLPIFRYGKSAAMELAKRLGRGLNHGGCKTFHFDRKRWRDWKSWHHGNTEQHFGCCYALNRYLTDLERCKEILHNTAFCYHLAMTCKEHFLKERIRLSTRVQTDVRLANREAQGKARDGERSAETRDTETAARTFDKRMMNSLFPVFDDNFLLPYLQNPLTDDALLVGKTL